MKKFKPRLKLTAHELIISIPLGIVNLCCEQSGRTFYTEVIGSGRAMISRDIEEALSCLAHDLLGLNVTVTMSAYRNFRDGLFSHWH